MDEDQFLAYTCDLLQTKLDRKSGHIRVVKWNRKHKHETDEMDIWFECVIN